MPNIHIHCHDQADAGLIVAEILALVGSRIRITIDNNDNHDIGGRPAAARAATETGRRIVETINAEERRQRELVKTQRYIDDMSNYEKNISVVCRGCQASIGAPCRKVHSGKEYKRPYVHSIRRHDVIMARLSEADAPTKRGKPTLVTSDNLPEWMNKPITLDEV